MMKENVILVNEQDEPQGEMEKLEAHQKGLMHRAFSIFIFNGDGEMLIQQRAMGKYHSGGLWTNACCSHPRPGETTDHAANRRLQEEMGIQCDINKIFDFTYHAQFDNGLIEHEFDHVYAGEYEGRILPDPTEVMGHRYISRKELLNELNSQPDKFTAWFRLSIGKISEWWVKNYSEIEN